MKKPTPAADKAPPIAAEPVSAYDAKTHLPKLLERAQRGEHFVITRHGKPVARLVPFVATSTDVVAQALARAAAHRGALARKGVSLSRILEADETVRQLAHRDHRY